jgi:signal transduction histidine kinase
VDTTGAGDIFHGAFCYAVLEGMPMRQVLEFSNAMAALNCTALGARGGEVILRVSRVPREARIDVIDTGPGIARDALDEVFRAYYSTKKGGTGLGLAMTRRIVEEHGGRITVTSEPGKGADFTIHLPVHPA